MTASMVIAEIAAERKRQIEVEGWTFEHDDSHTKGELAMAAALYASPNKHLKIIERHKDGVSFDDPWPWWNDYDDGGRCVSHTRAWWKPKSRRRNLVRAAALIVAEIERLDRTPAKDERREEAGPPLHNSDIGSPLVTVVAPVKARGW